MKVVVDFIRDCHEYYIIDVSVTSLGKKFKQDVCISPYHDAIRDIFDVAKGTDYGAYFCGSEWTLYKADYVCIEGRSVFEYKGCTTFYKGSCGCDKKYKVSYRLIYDKLQSPVKGFWAVYCNLEKC